MKNLTKIIKQTRWKVWNQAQDMIGIPANDYIYKNSWDIVGREAIHQIRFETAQQMWYQVSKSND